ncbi:hypothetical protein CULT_190071 [[Clostridium] ultunense Esp]|nr:hypothetical protein CULT_190071 [[Clostridium] ultunense Esp]
MLYTYDSLVFWLLLFFVLLLILRIFWKHLPFQIDWGNGEKEDPLKDLLHQQGYVLIRRHIRLPIQIHYKEETYPTRYFIDGVAKKGGKWYIVKVGRKQKPLLLTGSGIRDALLPYALLGKWDGILYVEPEKRIVHRFIFEMDRSLLPQPLRLIPYLLFFLAGLALAFLFK